MWVGKKKKPKFVHSSEVVIEGEGRRGTAGLNSAVACEDLARYQLSKSA